MTEPVSLDFYVDPACGWAWRTSLWLRHVAIERPITITWKLISLGVINAPADWKQGASPVRGAPAMRTLIRAQQVGGNEAVNKLLIAYGNALHGRSDHLSNAAVHERCLTEAGLPPSLYAAAQADPDTETKMIEDTREAIDKFKIFGVPTLVLKGSDLAVFGPVVHPVPVGKEALDLWDHVHFSLKQPYLYEMKRTRSKYDAPQFADERGLPATAVAV